MTTRRQILQASAASSMLFGLGASLAQAQALAQALEQVKIFFGFPPGSSGDICARRVGEKLAGSSYTKSAAIVENKPGAGGRIALEALKASPADGSVLAGVGLLPYGGLIDDMVKSQQLEFNRWGPLIKRVGFTAES